MFDKTGIKARSANFTYEFQFTCQEVHYTTEKSCSLFAVSLEMFKVLKK